MITKRMVENGYKQGFITLDIDPNMEAGTIARIGENWFYFGGLSASELNPDEYAARTPEVTIIDEIFAVLQEFAEENPDEYVYYEAYLAEHVKDSAENNIGKILPHCPMRHENGNCLPAGGFCSANKNICDALYAAYEFGIQNTLEKISQDHDNALKEGTWKPGVPECPVCGKNKFEHLDADIWADWQPEYCPRCGAKTKQNLGI